jgi:predicted alpha/beta superfamily hydrolase
MSTLKQPVPILNTEQHVVSSDIVGDSFKINVALPNGYAETDSNYPVLYLLDANIFFGLVTETARLLRFGGEIPDGLIVGIGYLDDAQHLGLRTRDLTPVPDDEGSREWLAKMSEGREVPIAFKGSGGAEPFLAFLRQELMPYLAERYRIDPDDTVLAGDSLGGLFALYTLFHQPEAFARYIIGSPSIYYGDAITLDYEAEYAAAHDDLPVTVFLSAGALEALYEPAFAAMLSNVARLTELLTSREYPGLKLTSHIFHGETHLSVIPATFSRGLRTVFAEV